MKKTLKKKQGVYRYELKEDVAQGTYANLAIITHSSSEFILDFIRVMPGVPKAGVQSRIILQYFLPMHEASAWHVQVPK